MLTAHLLGMFCAENQIIAAQMYDDESGRISDLAQPFPIRTLMTYQTNLNAQFLDGLWWQDLLFKYDASTCPKCGYKFAFKNGQCWQCLYSN